MTLFAKRPTSSRFDDLELLIKIVRLHWDDHEVPEMVDLAEMILHRKVKAKELWNARQALTTRERESRNSEARSAQTPGPHDRQAKH